MVVVEEVAVEVVEGIMLVASVFPTAAEVAVEVVGEVKADLADLVDRRVAVTLVFFSSTHPAPNSSII